MKAEHHKIHESCLNLCQGYVRREAPIVFALLKVGETKLYRELKIKNLYTYAVEVCELPEGAAYSFIAVGKMAKLYPCLGEAIKSRELTVSKANRILSALNAHNAVDLVAFAKTHTSKEIDREVRKLNPKSSVQSRIRPLSESTDLLNAAIPRRATENINRAQTLLAQKTSKHQGIPETIDLVFEDYVRRHDPLRRAERVKARASRKNSAQAEKVVVRKFSVSKDSAQAENTYSRTPLTAAEKQAVDLRDGRRCTHIDQNSQRCCEERWLHDHHIISVANGGANHPDNITTLCSFHHDLVHQMVFPLEGAISLLRSPQIKYLAG